MRPAPPRCGLGPRRLPPPQPEWLWHPRCKAPSLLVSRWQRKVPTSPLQLRALCHGSPEECRRIPVVGVWLPVAVFAQGQCVLLSKPRAPGSSSGR